MDKMRLSRARKKSKESKAKKKGFTVIEVMLFLAITGFLLMTVIGGTYASIATQRYNDSVRDFAEFLRQMYSEVISPESLGSVNGDYGGNSNTYAIYGKVLVFGINNDSVVHTATLVGDTSIPSGNYDFVEELQKVNVRLFCGIANASTGDAIQESTVDTYVPLWNTEIHTTKSLGGGILKGTVIIARSPSSGTVRTVYNKDLVPDISASDGCQPGSSNQKASNAFASDIKSNPSNYRRTDVNFCLKDDRGAIVRDVVLTADGHNNTAINLLDDEIGRKTCQ